MSNFEILAVEFFLCFLGFFEKCILKHNAVNTENIILHCYHNFFFVFLKKKIISASLGFFFLIIFKKEMLEKSKTSQNIKNKQCDICNYNCSKLWNLNVHLLTKKHKKKMEEINSEKKSETSQIQKTSHSKTSQNEIIIEPHHYSCSYCNFFTKKQSAFNIHIKTIKHKNNSTSDKENLSKYNCIHCNKEYHKKNSCTKHEKTCILNNEVKVAVAQVAPVAPVETIPTFSYHDIIHRLIQENQELRNFMTEQNHVMTEQSKEFMKTITEITKNSHTTNNNQTFNGNVNNNKFNINVFLNEKCKDAMNFSDFIENIEVSHEDLENNAQLGFVNGISKIIIDNLKQLSIYERPLHCSDVKRETMYIKDENKWEKEEDTKKLSNAIRQVSRKSMMTLNEWKEENPEYKDMDSEFSNKCMGMTKQSIAGTNRDIYYPKIIKNLAKETIIEKNEK